MCKLLDFVQMEEELQHLFGKPVDMVEMEAL
jgi:predicted nucleotidyltransferase